MLGAFIGILSLTACNRKPVTPEVLFEANFHPFPNVLVDLEKDSLSANPKVLTFLAYRNKNYEEALRYSDKINPLSEHDPIQLYRGVSFMALNKMNRAIEILEPLTDTSSEYKDAANWYLALCKLKQNDLMATAMNLKKLTNRSTYIRNEAQVLLKKVEEMKTQ